MKLNQFSYHLPQELIAQFPLKDRSEAKFLLLDRKTGDISHHTFQKIDTFLTRGDVLVLNNTKVFKARLQGKKESGGSVEILLIKEIDRGVWEAMVSHAKRIKEKTKIFFAHDVYATIKEKIGSRCHIAFNIPDEDIIKKYGIVPLPRYIKRNTVSTDEQYYQTIYAKTTGSIAAPTAGLHFTEEILETMSKIGVKIVEITLHIGPGTFKPIRNENIEEHTMEREYFELSDDVVEIVRTAHRIIGVGTSVCRALESYANTGLRSGSADLFIYPGYTFKIIDCLITNFHLPCSTPLLLVCAFAGKDLIFKAYNEAIKHRYRFLSYGDAMLIL
jgi:S-adenosylmethionine:tRNA ribosyltransferase-isomerase